MAWTPKVSVSLALALASCAPMAAPRPAARETVSLAPATVSTDQFESHPAFDPANGDLYFVRSSPQFQGWRILRSRCTASGWGPAEPAPFSGPGVEADPFFTADGRRLYFISSRPDPPDKTSADLDIWYVERFAAGWGPPVRMPAPVNSPAAESFPRIGRDGTLYFGSSRPGGHGQTDIYEARMRDGRWQVRNLGGTVSTSADDYEFEPARDGSFAILMSDGLLFRLEGADRGWGQRVPLLRGQTGLHVGPLLSPSGRTLLYAHSATPERSGELFRLDFGRLTEAWPLRCPRR